MTKEEMEIRANALNVLEQCDNFIVFGFENINDQVKMMTRTALNEDIQTRITQIISASDQLDEMLPIDLQLAHALLRLDKLKAKIEEMRGKL